MNLDWIFWIVMLTDVTLLTAVFTTPVDARFGIRVQSLLLLGTLGVILSFAAGNFRINGYEVGWMMNRVHTAAFYWLLMSWCALVFTRPHRKTPRVDAKTR